MDGPIIGCVRVCFDPLDKKLPKKDHFMDAALPQKHLKTYNLTTNNAIKMELTTIVYLHNTYQLVKNLGVNHRA